MPTGRTVIDQTDNARKTFIEHRFSSQRPEPITDISGEALGEISSQLLPSQRRPNPNLALQELPILLNISLFNLYTLKNLLYILSSAENLNLDYGKRPSTLFFLYGLRLKCS